MSSRVRVKPDVLKQRQQELAHNAKALTEMLRLHSTHPEKPWLGIFAAEIQSPDQTRRADAIWQPLTIAGGNGMVGHEIKVSRSDLMREIEDPSKADPWAQYCSKWYLVLP